MWKYLYFTALEKTALYSCTHKKNCIKKTLSQEWKIFQAIAVDTSDKEWNKNKTFHPRWSVETNIPNLL